MSELVEAELETQVQELELKALEAQQNMEELKEKLEKRVAEARKDTEIADSQIVRFKKDLFDSKHREDLLKKKVIQLENAADKMEEDLRAKEGLIQDLQSKLSATLEQLTILELEAREMKEVEEVEKERMKHKLHEMQEDILNRKRRHATINVQT